MMKCLCRLYITSGCRQTATGANFLVHADTLQQIKSRQRQDHPTYLCLHAHARVPHVFLYCSDKDQVP